MIIQPWATQQNIVPSDVMLLDRDGVLVNLDRPYASAISDIKLIPGVTDAVGRLAAAGFKAVMVTNQSGIGRGFVSQQEALRINEWIMRLIDPMRSFIQFALICPHAPSDRCSCRKPSIRGILDAIHSPNSWTDAWFIGDQMSDMRCAESLGARTVLVRSGHGLETEGSIHLLRRQPVVVNDFGEFVERLLTNCM